jgi:NADH pyrophosphatase NudC (nudix superfamily)
MKEKTTLRIRHEVQAVIFDDDAEGDRKVLLLKKTDFSAKKYRWRLLKGGVHDGETETEALEREILEETGLRNIRILDKVHSYEFAFKNVKHMVSSYLVKADSNEQIKLQKTEVADCLWTTKEDALRLLYWNNEKEPLKRLK